MSNVSRIPTTYKALQLEKLSSSSSKDDRSAPKNVAVVRTVNVPAQQDGTVLIKIFASGFNRRDAWALMNLYPGLQFHNSTFGCDGVGVVVRGTRSNVKEDRVPPHPEGLVVLVPTRGWTSDVDGPEAALPGAPSDVTRNRLGGTGFGLLGCTKPTNGVGTFAEYCQVEDDQVVNVPRHLNAVQAAALPCGGVTAYRALFTKARVQKGHNVLITGIGGGVALLALQFAVAAGLNVYVTGGTPEKVQRAITLGARGGVVYREKDWPKQIAAQIVERSKQRPYLDAVVDSAGGNLAAQAAVAGLRVGGRIVCFGMTAEPKITVTMREVLRNVDLVGSTMGSEEEFKQMIVFVDRHKIVPVVDTVLDGMEQAEQGFQLLNDADQRTGGKVILRISSSAAESSVSSKL